MQVERRTWVALALPTRQMASSKPQGSSEARLIHSRASGRGACHPPLLKLLHGLGTAPSGWQVKGRYTQTFPMLGDSGVTELEKQTLKRRKRSPSPAEWRVGTLVLLSPRKCLVTSSHVSILPTHCGESCFQSVLYGSPHLLTKRVESQSSLGRLSEPPPTPLELSHGICKEPSSVEQPTMWKAEAGGSPDPLGLRPA